MIQNIIAQSNASVCEVYLGGSDNFRKALYPPYKGNRTKPPPTWLQDCREILVTQYGAVIVNGMETDDMLGIRQTELGDTSRICSIDKDLLQIPGHHLNWVKRESYYTTPLEGLRTMYKQLIAGDGTDNIPSFDGKVRNSIPKFIQKLQEPIDQMDEEESMLAYCEDIFNDVASCHLNAQLVYILRRHEKYWKPPH